MDNQTKTNYSYQGRSLVIKIPTSDPAAFHELLMKAITSSMRNYITSGANDDSHLALLDLLEALHPKENDLSEISINQKIT